MEEDVLVEYGADIHAADCGSGFPTKETESLFPDDEVNKKVHLHCHLFMALC